MRAKLPVTPCWALSLLMVCVACTDADSNNHPVSRTNDIDAQSAMIAAQRASDNAQQAASKAALETRFENFNHHCNDMIVIGKVQSRDYQNVAIEGDPIGHGWIAANIEVTKLVTDNDGNHRLQAKYFGHAFLRDDIDFLLVLHPVADDSFVIESAIKVVARHPKISPNCNGSPIQPDEFRRG